MPIVFRANRRGLREVALSDPVLHEMERRMQKVKDAAERDKPPSQNLYMTGYRGRNRARASVIAPGGLASERRDRYLGRSIDAARE